MRSYTVAEIDDLREACTLRWLFGTAFPTFGSQGRVYNQEQKVRCVEELVRTYMLAGIIAEDIYEEDRKKHEASNSNCKIS